MFLSSENERRILGNINTTFLDEITEAYLKTIWQCFYYDSYDFIYPNAQF